LDNADKIKLNKFNEKSRAQADLYMYALCTIYKFLIENYFNNNYKNILNRIKSVNYICRIDGLLLFLSLYYF
jgi:hypothetical protein